MFDTRALQFSLRKTLVLVLGRLCCCTRTTIFGSYLGAGVELWRIAKEEVVLLFGTLSLVKAVEF